MKLTTEQKSYWIKNGFLKLKNVFGQDDLCQVKAWITKIETSPADSEGGILHYYEIINGEKIITRSERYLNFSKELTDFITQGIVVRILEQLMGSEVVLFKEKINYKYPMGGGYAPHQDAAAYKYISHHVTCLVAPESTTSENGCLWLAAGHHQKHLIALNSDGCIDKKVAEQLPWHELPTNPGDLIFFDSYTPHFSSPNLSTRARKTLYLTYNESKYGEFRELYYKDRSQQLENSKNRKKKQISTIRHFQGEAEN